MRLGPDRHRHPRHNDHGRRKHAPGQDGFNPDGWEACDDLAG